MLTVRGGPIAGLTSQVALLLALGATVGLSGAGWVVGLLCAATLDLAVARGLARSGSGRLGPADLVTLSRATLACGVAALTVDSFVKQPAVTTLVGLSAVALVLDAVDGWVARRTRSASPFGARFDGEVDAFLILVLSVYVAGQVGGWVLAIGAARYVFAVAGWALPWMRRQLPFRYWRKVVAATQGIVLTVVAADVMPAPVTYVALAVALALLAESFGRDVWWLWRHRRAEAGAAVGRRRWHPAVTALADVLAVALVWFALVAPNQAHLLTPRSLLLVPVEGLVVAGLVLVLPPRARRALAAVVGLLLGLLSVVKVLDIGFFTAFDRPFNAVTDPGYLGPALDLVSDSVGPAGAVVAVAAAVLLLVLLLVGMPLAVGRLTGLVARHRRWSARAVAALVMVWAFCAAAGLQNGAGEPVAAANAGRLAVGQVRAISTELESLQNFEAAASEDRFHPQERDLLAGLRGKDVVIAFVESYGRVALEGLPASPQVRALLDDGTRRLHASGYSSRSAFLDSPTFGGLSWLAHSTLQSGLWVDSERRYARLLAGDRMTLSRAFRIAGWRTVAVMPSYEGGWPEGEDFYQFHEIHGRHDLGYRGPTFGWSRIPDQFVLSGFRRLELERGRGAPVMAKIDLTSSHSPWAPLPRMVDWENLGDGSVFTPIHRRGDSAEEVWRDPEDIKAAYVKSVSYTLNTVISFVEEYGDDDLVLILLGDHQPLTVVSGHGASHDVPVTVVAHDPAVVDAISGWGWQDGMRPDDQAPVWPMSSFRDRFLAAYSPLSGDPVRPAFPAQR